MSKMSVGRWEGGDNWWLNSGMSITDWAKLSASTTC